MNGTYTREVNGNKAIRLGDVLLDVEDVTVGDRITITVEEVHGRGD